MLPAEADADGEAVVTPDGVTAPVPVELLVAVATCVADCVLPAEAEAEADPVRAPVADGAPLPEGLPDLVAPGVND